MSSPLDHLLKPELVELNLKASSAADAVHEVARLLESNPAVCDFAKFHAAIAERERINPTSLGHGVILPHARTAHVQNIVLAAGRSREGIWFENSHLQAHLIFVIGTPTEMVREYLAVVAALTRLLRNQNVREGLMRAETAREFLAQLR